MPEPPTAPGPVPHHGFGDDPDPTPAHGVDGLGAAAEALAAEREEAARLVAALTEELDGIIASVDMSGNDDEHDPDGATNGYERAKATSLLDHARAKLALVTAAEARLATGTYGRCEACGAPITPERLEALPATERCTACAR